MEEKIICSATDNIEVLGLSVRVHRALKRAKIWDIGEVIELNDDQLFAVHNLGDKGVTEIRERLSRVDLLDQPPLAHENGPPDAWSVEPQILIDFGPPMIPRHEVVDWLQMMLARQIKARLLHPQLQIDGYTLAALVDVHSRPAGLYEILLKVLTAPISVAQELERLLVNLPQREIEVLIRRFSLKRQTLQALASDFEITRERVRQIQQNAIRRIVSSASTLLLLRIRSALLFADDMALSFDEWSNLLRGTGLLGAWTNERIVDSDEFELLNIVCRLTEDTEFEFEIPESLNCMLILHDMGLSRAPARMLRLLESYSGVAERLVMRHLRYSGAVSIDWLVNQDTIGFSRSEMRLILESRGFSKVGENWYMAYEYVPHELEKDCVIHKSLLKVFQYCGPLSKRDLYFGIERTRAKTDFPVPPLGVLEQVLENYGYVTEDELWFWPGDSSEELNAGETAIWETINELGGVAHHSELMQAILDSGLSGASLHATLRRSPLFDNFGQALYRLRGTQPERNDIERARDAAQRTSVDLSVERDTYGNIIVGANLGILAIANGTIVSERMPNLEGVWQCMWGEGESSEIRVTKNEIRGLLSVTRFYEYAVGDRISLIFNVLDRTVATSVIEGDT